MRDTAGRTCIPRLQQRISLGLAHFTQRQSLVPCVPVPFTGGNIGHVVYAMTEKDLLSLTGADPQNPTFDLPCRDVFAKGQKAIEVTGPFPELAPAAAKVHEGYWNK